MAANSFLRDGYMKNEHLFHAAKQRSVYESFLVIFQIYYSCFLSKDAPTVFVFTVFSKTNPLQQLLTIS